MNRRKLWYRSPNCHWCGRVTLLVNESIPRQATVDHILCRGEVRKWGQWADNRNQVLACNECNQRRNKEFLDRTAGLRVVFVHRRCSRIHVQPGSRADELETFNRSVQLRVWQLAAEGDNREDLYEIVTRELIGFCP